MEIKGNDIFTVTRPSVMNIDYQKCLSLLYLPLIGPGAYAVYNLLHTLDADSDSISHLCTLTGTGIVELADALQKLEQYKLLKTFFNSTSGVFRFSLQAPLSGPVFLSQDAFGRIFVKKLGREAYEMVSGYFEQKPEFGDDDMDITSELDLSVLKDWTDDDETLFSSLKETLYETETIEFDIARFNRECREIVMPSILRTPDNMKTIAQMGTVYGIDVETMIKLVGKAVDFDTCTFDVKRLRTMCLGAKVADTTSDIDDYSVTNINYLYNLQGKLSINENEKRLVESLKEKFRMSREVMNYLFRYAYENNDKKVTKSYCEKIAKDWALHKIDTVEKASEYVSAKNPKGKNLPDFRMEAAEKLPEQDIKSLRAKLFREGD